MATIKCENCGTIIETSGNDAIVFCHNCGTKCTVQKNDSKDVFLKRGFLALEDKEWKKADEFFEQVLNIDPECGVGYLGKLMSELKISSRNELKNCTKPFNETNNYKKIMRFGSDELKSELIECIDIINNRNDENQNEKIYAEASKIANSSKNANKLYKAAKTLAELGDYKDSAQLAEDCLEKAKKLKEKADKNETKVIKFASISSSVIAFLIIFTIILTTVVVPAIKYSSAKKAMENGNYKEAIIFFGDNYNYKDNAELFAEALSKIAIKDTLDTSYNHTVALGKDGTVVAIGEPEAFENYEYSYYSYYYNGERTVTDSVVNWNDIVAIAAGNKHTVGLKSDGTVVAVGDTDGYETTSSSYYSDYETVTETVSDWTDIVSIAAASQYTAGLKSDGTVVTVGEDDFYVSSWSNIIDIAAGGDHLIGLKADGTVVAEGTSSYYTEDTYSYYDDKDTVENWTDIVAIAAGDTHTVGLKSNGTVVALGENDEGQCYVSGWTDIVAIAAGYECTFGLKADGTIVMAGENEYAEAITGWKDIVAISATSNKIVGLKSDGTLVAVGDDDDHYVTFLNGVKDIKIPE